MLDDPRPENLSMATQPRKPGSSGNPWPGMAEIPAFAGMTILACFMAIAIEATNAPLASTEPVLPRFFYDKVTLCFFMNFAMEK